MTLIEAHPDAIDLAEYAGNRSQSAFAALVRRYLDLVYSTAVRMVRDPHLAEDVTQAAFAVLARKAREVHPPALAGWLVNTTRLAAKQALRKAAVNAEPVAADLLSRLDDGLAKLSEVDRTAAVRRFLLGESFAKVADAIGTTEEEARQRVERAVAKLGTIFAKRGVVTTGDALMEFLAGQKASVAPMVAAEAATPNAAATCLAKRVSRGMTFRQVKVVLAITVGILLLAAASAQIIRRASSSPPATQTAVDYSCRLGRPSMEKTRLKR